MKQKFLVCLLVMLLLAVGLSGCGEKEEEKGLSLKPIVRVTNENYNFTTFYSTFWSPPIWYEFTAEYQGNVSVKLKDQLINDMKSQVKNLGENEDLFIDCLEFAMRNKTYLLPCLAEKTNYTRNPGDEQYADRRSDTDYPLTKEVWIFVFNTNHGSGWDDIGHIQISVISIDNQELFWSQACG